MSRKPSGKEIKKFLSKVRQAIDNKNVRFEEREKNMRCLFELGIKQSDAIEIIYDLSNNEHYDGPKPHENIKLSENNVWEFKKLINGNTVYIKIYIMIYNDQLVIISFHKDEKNSW